MGSLDGLTQPPAVRICRVRQVLEEMDASDRKILEEAIASDKWSAHGLSNALRERGVRIDDSPIKRHRRGICSCSTG